MAGKTGTKRTAQELLDEAVSKGRDLDLEDVIAYVLNADDETCHTLGEAVQQRLKAIRQSRAMVVKATIRPGDKVRLTGIRPKVLDGIEVEVVRRDRTRVLVRMPTDDRRLLTTKFLPGSEVKVPASCIVTEQQ